MTGNLVGGVDKYRIRLMAMEHKTEEIMAVVVGLNFIEK
jgi:hypothetical protein